LCYCIGATNAFAYDLQAACLAFVRNVTAAVTFNQEGIKVLLIGADKMSSIVDYTDRSTCIIFW
jgi:3-oxoacyl-[acyl-carrier-protein] synthase-3